MAEIFDWNVQKNQTLKIRHGVSFEEVVIAFQEKRLLADMRHPSDQYAHQRLAVVLIEDYTYAVPYIQKGSTRFLKSIYPSRKLHKQYAPNLSGHDR